MIIASWPQNIVDFLVANNKGKSCIEITNLINQTFNTDYTTDQVKRKRNSMHLISGITGYFEKGHQPHNKGKKGFCPEGFKAQQYKKGHIPINKCEIGEERITTDGYVTVKIAQPNIWKRKHILIWEKHHGKIPEGYTILFKDNNKLNCELENLCLVSRAAHLILNKNQLRSNDKNLTETGILIAKITEQLNKRKREKQNEN